MSDELFEKQREEWLENYRRTHNMTLGEGWTRPIDYKDGKIYKIVNDVDNEIYIGSTVSELEYRFHMGHMNANIAEHCKKIGGKWHYRIELLKNFPCETREELVEEEGRMYRLYKPSLNCNIPGGPNEEEKAEQIERRYKRRAEEARCEVCNLTMRHDSLYMHQKTKKHIGMVESRKVK